MLSESQHPSRVLLGWACGALSMCAKERERDRTSSGKLLINLKTWTHSLSNSSASHMGPTPTAHIEFSRKLSVSRMENRSNYFIVLMLSQWWFDACAFVGFRFQLSEVLIKLLRTERSAQHRCEIERKENFLSSGIKSISLSSKSSNVGGNCLHSSSTIISTSQFVRSPHSKS